MDTTTIHLSRKTAQGFVVPCGTFSIVFARTDIGMVACGAIDVAALDTFSYPAAKVRAAAGSIATVDDLLNAAVVAVNAAGEKKGLRTGMAGREALECL